MCLRVSDGQLEGEVVRVSLSHAIGDVRIGSAVSFPKKSLSRAKVVAI